MLCTRRAGVFGEQKTRDSTTTIFRLGFDLFKKKTLKLYDPFPRPWIWLKPLTCLYLGILRKIDPEKSENDITSEE